MARSVWSPEDSRFDIKKHQPADVLAKQITDFIGPVDDYFIYQPTHVMCAVYIRPEKVGSLYLPSSNRAEDIYQGKAFLVLKKGELAFKSSANYKFAAKSPEVGEWVAARPAECELHELFRGYDIRIFEDTKILHSLKHPEEVF